jgi:hypothetical protein
LEGGGIAAGAGLAGLGAGAAVVGFALAVAGVALLAAWAGFARAKVLGADVGHIVADLGGLAILVIAALLALAGIGAAFLPALALCTEAGAVAERGLAEFIFAVEEAAIAL